MKFDSFMVVTNAILVTGVTLTTSIVGHAFWGWMSGVCAGAVIAISAMTLAEHRKAR